VQIDFGRQLPNFALFIHTRRRLTMFLACSVGLVAAVVLLLPNGGANKGGDLAVSEGLVAVPIQVSDPAVVQIVQAGDFVDVMSTSRALSQNQSARRVASKVKVLKTLPIERGKNTLVIESTPEVALALAGAANDLISVALLPK